jgi:hypothetical protein
VWERCEFLSRTRTRSCFKLTFLVHLNQSGFHEAPLAVVEKKLSRRCFVSAAERACAYTMLFAADSVFCSAGCTSYRYIPHWLARNALAAPLLPAERAKITHYGAPTELRARKKSKFADTIQNQCCAQSTLCDEMQYSSDGTEWTEAAAVTRLMAAANSAGAKLLFIPLSGPLLFSIRPFCF